MLRFIFTLAFPLAAQAIEVITWLSYNSFLENTRTPISGHETIGLEGNLFGSSTPCAMPPKTCVRTSKPFS